jgi:hypothetical protein
VTVILIVFSDVIKLGLRDLYIDKKVLSRTYSRTHASLRPCDLWTMSHATMRLILITRCMLRSGQGEKGGDVAQYQLTTW